MNGTAAAAQNTSLCEGNEALHIIPASQNVSFDGIKNSECVGYFSIAIIKNIT